MIYISILKTKIFVFIKWSYKVDDVIVDTSNSMETSSQWIQHIRSLSMLLIANQNQIIWNHWNQVEEGVDQAFGMKILLCFPTWCLGGGVILPLFNVVWVHNITSKYGSCANVNQVHCQHRLCHVSEEVIGKIKCCQIGFSVIEYP